MHIRLQQYTQDNYNSNTWHLKIQHVQKLNNTKVRTHYIQFLIFFPTRIVLTLSPQPFTYHHLLTYPMVQSPSWAANWFAASQEIPRISRNLKVHYRTHKRPPPISILAQPNPVQIPTSYLMEIHPNIIHPSTNKSPQWSLSPGFPTKTLYTPSPYPYTPNAQPISFFSILSPFYWYKIFP